MLGIRNWEDQAADACSLLWCEIVMRIHVFCFSIWKISSVLTLGLSHWISKSTKKEADIGTGHHHKYQLHFPSRRARTVEWPTANGSSSEDEIDEPNDETYQVSNVVVKVIFKKCPLDSDSHLGAVLRLILTDHSCYPASAMDAWTLYFLQLIILIDEGWPPREICVHRLVLPDSWRAVYRTWLPRLYL